MKKCIALLFFVLFGMISITAQAAHQNNQMRMPNQQAAKHVVNLYFFWSKDCPHCIAAHPFLDKLQHQYSWLKVHSFDVSSSQRNSQHFAQMARAHGKETSFVPTFFIGDRMIVGYTSAQTTGAEIRNAILEHHKGQ